MLNKIKIFLSIIILLINPVVTQATCISCVITYDVWEHAAHAFWLSMQNSLLDATGLEIEAEENRGKSQVLHQEVITATIQKSSEGHMMSYAATLKQHVLTQTTYDNNIDFSPLAQSSFACCIENEGSGITNGNNAKDGLYQDVYNSIYNYNNKSNQYQSDTELIEALSAPSGAESVKSSYLFPGNDNIPLEDTNQVVENLILITNPAPFASITNPNNINTPSGKAYRILKKIKNARIAVPQQAVSEIVSTKSGQYDMQDWATQMTKSIGTGAHPNLQTGTMSADGILTLQTESRYANPSWLIDLHRKPPAGLLRELTLSRAIILEFERRILQSAEKEVFMAASSSAQKTNKTLEKRLEKAYTLVLNQTKIEKEMVANNEK